MAGKYLILEEIRNGETIEAGRVEGSDPVIVGRDSTDAQIVIPSDAVSRRHLEIGRVRGHFTIRDLGSTNGTWINGFQIQPERLRLLRSGDLLQIADVSLKVTESMPAGIPEQSTGTSVGMGRSLLVFRGLEFLDEYPIPEFGQALVIGGPTPDLEISGNMDQNASVRIERKGIATTLLAPNSRILVSVNGKPVEGSLSLVDGDEIEVAEYRILFQDLADGSRSTTPLGSGQGRLNDWGEGADSGAFNNKSKMGTLFGKPADQATDESVLYPSSTHSKDTPFGGRYISENVTRPIRPAAEEPESVLEDRIVVFVGFGILIALLVLLLVWLFGVR